MNVLLNGHSAGGKIENGETKEMALKRELKEELDCEIIIDDFIKTIHFEYETFSLTLHAYKCHLISDFNLKEHIDYKWATIDEMRTMDFCFS